MRPQITATILEVEQLFQVAQQLWCLMHSTTITITCAPSVTSAFNDLQNAVQDQLNSVSTALAAIQQLYKGITQVVAAYPGFQSTSTQEINALPALNTAYNTC